MYIKNIIILPYMLQVLGIGAVSFTLMHSYLNKFRIKKIVSPEIRFWIIFAIESLVVGFFIAANQSILFSSLFTYLQYIIFMLILIYICDFERDIQFIIFIGKCASMLCALHTIFFGESSGWGGRIAMTESMNTNSLGILLVFGVFCILYNINLKNNYSFFWSLISISIYTYVIFLTGSRKSFLALAFLIVSWVVFSLRYKFKYLSKTKKISLTFVFLIILIAIALVFIPLFYNSILFDRFINLLEVGEQTRKNMYNVAWQLFKENVWFGVGFDQYKVVSGFGAYSHTTYGEALATFGLIGSILYFIPYLMLLLKFIKMSLFKVQDLDKKSNSRLLLGIYITFLLLGMGIVHYYNPTTYLVFASLISYYNINTPYNLE